MKSLVELKTFMGSFLNYQIKISISESDFMFKGTLEQLN